MSEPASVPPVAVKSRAWPIAVVILGVATLLVGATLFTVWQGAKAAKGAVEKSAEAVPAVIREIGQQGKKIAGAFNEGTVRQEFMSQAAELAGTTYLQVATLKQTEIFRREESGSTAWGLVPLPRVVVQAQAPVEYTYYVDLAGDWSFLREGTVLNVIPPQIAANTPAMDVSALRFYTLEGSLIPSASGVREKLKASLTASLLDRAGQNADLVRELGRRRISEFFEKWMREKFTDADELHVKVVFPDERPAVLEKK